MLRSWILVLLLDASLSIASFFFKYQSVFEQISQRTHNFFPRMHLWWKHFVGMWWAIAKKEPQEALRVGDTQYMWNTLHQKVTFWPAWKSVCVNKNEYSTLPSSYHPCGEIWGWWHHNVVMPFHQQLFLNTLNHVLKELGTILYRIVFV